MIRIFQDFDDDEIFLVKKDETNIITQLNVGNRRFFRSINHLLENLKKSGYKWDDANVIIIEEDVLLGEIEHLNDLYNLKETHPEMFI